MSQRGLEKIPQPGLAIWEHCRVRSDFELVVAPPGWRMAGIIRERQVQRGDILLVLGGGGGAEHLAELYRDEGKPVIPIWTELGAFNEDGKGGSRALHEQALDAPKKFFRLRDGVGSESARLVPLRLDPTPIPRCCPARWPTSYAISGRQLPSLSAYSIRGLGLSVR